MGISQWLSYILLAFPNRWPITFNSISPVPTGKNAAIVISFLRNIALLLYLGKKALQIFKNPH
jgi:hypothetical protein